MDYLTTYPAAHDTIEGIAEWWISRQRLTRLTEEIEGVVTELTSRGVLEAVRHGDGRVSYRAAKARRRAPGTTRAGHGRNLGRTTS